MPPKAAKKAAAASAAAAAVAVPAGAAGEGADDDPVVPICDHKRPPSAFVTALLKAINAKRTLHWVPPLVWSDQCYAAAKRQADRCMEAGAVVFGPTETVDGVQGECIRGPAKAPLSLKAKCAEDLAAAFYAEVSKYKWDKPGPSSRSRNFAQMMWSDTTSVGAALSADGRFFVAHFFPAIGDAPAWMYARCVQPARKGPAPWQARDPTPGPAPDDLTDEDLLHGPHCELSGPLFLPASPQGGFRLPLVD